MGLEGYGIRGLRLYQMFDELIYRGEVQKRSLWARHGTISQNGFVIGNTTLGG